MKKYLIAPGFWLLLTTVFCLHIKAQTTSFSYQGRLADNGAAASGTYDFQFSLYDALSNGAQIGATLTRAGVTVTNGVFSVQLDFGANPFTSGADRYLEVSVKKPADGAYIALNPRQQLTSSPYSIRTLSAGSADALSAACVACVDDAKIDTVSASKVTGTVASAATATTATTAGNVTGTVAVANGGTGAANAAGARTNLGLGSLATVSPTGTASASTFLRGDNTWATAGSGGGMTLELVATKTSPQTLAIGGSSVPPEDLTFNNTVTAPAAGTFDGTSYTVGQTGNYLITVFVMHTSTSTSTVVPTLLVDGTSTIFGVGMQNGNIPSGTFGRGTLSVVMRLTAGQVIKIKVSNSSTALTVPLSTDGSTRLSIVKF